MRSSRNLVIVRCGDNSLHHDWTGGERNWELAVSYFGSDEHKPFPDALTVHRFKGGKWDGLTNFFLTNPNVLNDYDYFWLPDDDIKTSADVINRMFDLVNESKFELAQPSLSPESYLSHLICAWNPIFDYRLVNFVEIMVPVLHSCIIRQVIPILGDSKSGFGLDFIWQRFTSDPSTKVAIIDKVTVTHTRPVGGALKQLLAREGKTSAEEEGQRFLASYDKVTEAEIVLGGRLWTGTNVTVSWLATTLAALGWALRPLGRHSYTYRLTPLRFLVWVARHWRTSMLEQIREGVGHQR